METICGNPAPVKNCFLPAWSIKFLFGNRHFLCIILLILLFAIPIPLRSEILTQSPYEPFQKEIEAYVKDERLLPPRAIQVDIVKLFFQNCLDLLQSRFGKAIKAVAINTQPQPDTINIYIIDKSDDPFLLLARTSNEKNCGVVGENMILCDSSLLSVFQNDPRLPVPPEAVVGLYEEGERFTELLNDAISSFSIDTIFWIIGHEIGHIAYSHDRSKNFAAKFVREEEEADDFFLAAVYPEEMAGYILLVLNNFIDRIAQEEWRKQGQDEGSFTGVGVTRHVKVKALADNHLHFLIRAALLASSLNNWYEWESPQFWENLLSRIEVEEETTHDEFSYFIRGVLKERAKKSQEAVLEFTTVLNINPKNTSAYNHRAEVLSGLQRYNEAIDDATNAIQLNPNFSGNYVVRAQAMFNKGEYEQAIKDAEQALAINPHDPNALITAGAGYLRLDRLLPGLQNLEKAAKVSPPKIQMSLKEFLMRFDCTVNPPC